MRKELQRKMFRERAGIKVIGFEKRLAKERSELAKRFWGEIKIRSRGKKVRSEWEEKRKKFLEERGMNEEGLEDEGRKVEGLIKREKELQREERREQILRSRYNTDYKWMKGEGVLFEERLEGE